MSTVYKTVIVATVPFVVAYIFEPLFTVIGVEWWFVGALVSVLSLGWYGAVGVYRVQQMAEGAP